MSSFGPTGLTLDGLNEIFGKIIADVQALQGDNIKETQDGVLGGYTTILSEAIADQNELIEYVVVSFQPSNAFGVFLSELVRFNGITRNEQSFSQVQLQVTANTAGVTLPAGKTVSDPDNAAVLFQTDAEIVVAPSATESVSASAVNPGPIEAAPNTLTKIENPTFGWASVTNAAAATTGFNEETDTELRARRDIAAARVAASGEAAIFTALFDIQDVSDVAVHSNRGTVTDALGVPPGQVWSIVEDGAAQDIAQVLSEHVAAGIGTFGAVSTIYANPITGQDETWKYSRPTEKPTYITLELLKGADYPGDGDDQIKASVNAYFVEVQKLGVKVGYFRVADAVNEVEGHDIQSMLIGFTSPPTGTSDLTVAINEKAVTDDTRIVIV